MIRKKKKRFVRPYACRTSAYPIFFFFLNSNGKCFHNIKHVARIEEEQQREF